MIVVGDSLSSILGSLGGGIEIDLDSFGVKKKEEVSLDWTNFGFFTGRVGSVDGIFAVMVGCMDVGKRFGYLLGVLRAERMDE